MLKFIPILVFVIILTATTGAFAKNEEEKEKNENRLVKVESQESSQKQSKPEQDLEQKRLEEKKLQLKRLEASGSSQACDPELEWKNHGAYVSCIAKLKLGGKTVSEAARSDIGKKSNTGTPSASPDASASAEPSIVPSPTATESASPSATPDTEESFVLQQGKNLIDNIEFLLDSLRGLFGLR